MHLREVELGPISEVEVDRDQAELGAASSQASGGAQANLILVIGYARYLIKEFSATSECLGCKLTTS